MANAYTCIRAYEGGYVFYQRVLFGEQARRKVDEILQTGYWCAHVLYFLPKPQYR